MRLSLKRATETQRHRGKSFFFCLCVSATLWLVTAGVTGLTGYAQDKPPAKRNVWDGVYSEKQAERGATLFAERCSSCHGADMAGGAGIPSLVAPDFAFAWNNNRAGGLYMLLSSSMPADAPGSLRPEQYVDLMAAIFKANEFPGTEMTELPVARDALDDILITRTKP
jgi:S-disulfanyl-L-cysteine oxidoreductase SoxD